MRQNMRCEESVSSFAILSQWAEWRDSTENEETHSSFWWKTVWNWVCARWIEPDSTRFSDCRRFFVDYLSASAHRKMYLDIFEELFAVCVSATTLPQLFWSAFLERFRNGLNCLCVLLFRVWRRIRFFIRKFKQNPGCGLKKNFSAFA